ncbi:hypothetical protein B14911_25850 [Bacillus sp. NRRL B-14911]|uniref:Translocation protein TolB n=1 Tax=Bacillus infantis NRRL B-14911 TaxID=1367477 RepID=U5LBJ5_9BACI|nr:MULTISPECIES: PD40 domain-containing protein [Bacillus]AGX04768.1 hypothetical protein N288_14340 [Bacillus infantis NRRL B-14911]EAR68147.1 hypothetical protein B14911_25850 [Bacillus sp. NRRL B-14911]RYI29483.1 translocation protein TolB [Bacillus infantis]
MRLRIFLCIVIIFASMPLSSQAEGNLKAVFIRDGNLWLAEGKKETRLTEGGQASDPKWSYDGRFIAYLSAEGEQRYLYIYDLQKNRSYQPYKTIETYHFEWSPDANTIAYTSRGVLNITKTKNGIPKGFENVSLGVSDFTWTPDGKGFIASSQAELLPTGWGPVRLFKIKKDAALNAEKIKPFYTIKTDPDKLFAIDANHFKWSTDDKWISFLGVPTASWSADSNTLIVLSAGGTRFQTIGKMLNQPDWFKWSPAENKIAYISGEGRFLVQDKRTSVADIPISAGQKDYTPEGYVDIDLAWLTADEVITARAKENKDWKEGPVPEMYSKLYNINIKSGIQKQITFPKPGSMDIKPQVTGKYIAWMRKESGRLQGEIWIKEGAAGKAKVWLERVDGAPVFYNSK